MGRRWLPAALALLLGACALGPRGLEREVERILPPLEVPPPLELPEVEEEMALPEFSPSEEGPAYVEREGSRRWLVAEAPPQRVWPLVEAYWQAEGWAVAWRDRERGLMLTGWRQVRPRDGEAEDRAWAEGVRERYGLRLEPGRRLGTSEVTLAQQRLRRAGEGWEPLPPDPVELALQLERLREHLERRLRAEERP